MKRIDQILHHPRFKDYLGRIEEAEQGRIFCGHQLQHLLDVCRLGWILYWEEGLLADLDQELYKLQNEQTEQENEPLMIRAVSEEGYCSYHKEWIYGAGLLHDIGRWKQYEDGSDHARVSEELAPLILADCGFLPEEIRLICTAIGNHRNKQVAGERSLSGCLFRADKRSRLCFACKAEAGCDWSRQKKNMQLNW